MHKNIGPALKNAKNLIHVREELVRLIKAIRNGKETRMGYVAGIITSDGPKHLEANRKRLTDYVKKLRKMHKFPMFSATDVFSDELYSKLQEWKLSFEERELEVRSFWREILKSGHITDIFMTPRWDRSKGATDEHKTAKEIGLRIHYVKTH